MLSHLLKFEEEPQTVLGRQALGFEAPHDGKVCVNTHRGLIIKILEKFNSFREPTVVLEGWLGNTMV